MKSVGRAEKKRKRTAKKARIPVKKAVHRLDIFWRKVYNGP
jgi:hypothetical protein